jgi:glyoxylase-like metal-dependent hydrolase (beta-lactamase superfamily II)
MMVGEEVKDARPEEPEPVTGTTQFVCATCGTLYPASEAPPRACPICQDVRQYVPDAGQRWTTTVELVSRHRNVVERLEPSLYAIRSEPRLGIGQRALLLQTPEGNVLWDCITLLDRPTVEAVRALGGVAAIAISHPHYYSAQRLWAEAFDAPVLLHGADRAWVVDAHPRVRAWEGEQQRLWEGVTLVRAGGHFPGGTVLHWEGGAGGAGVLLSGDILQVTPDRGVVGFMYSYPNYLPLPSWEVDAVADAVLPLAFDRIYGAFPGGLIAQGARDAVEQGRRRYRQALRGELPGLRPPP